MSRWFKSLRRAESGQSVIILAIGFIALVGFVGITTDVSLMFVRYSQLSRAVDSAAISAANQMRQDRNLANVRLAATQFIEFHGIDPTEVEVQTCLSLPEDQRATDELCSDDNAKLVRVTARTISPTVFMRLLGIQSFPLEASAVSQTASIDVVLVMDVSESMLRYTTYEDWARIGLGVIYRPPRLQEILQAKALPNDQGATAAFWKFNVNADTPALLTVPQQVVNNRLYYVSTGGSPAPGQGTPTGTPPIPDANYRVLYNDSFFTAEYGTQAHPRDLCRVRFFPTSVNYAVNSFPGYRNTDGTYTDLLTLYTQSGLASWLQTYNTTSNWNFFGFVPTYNFYGCCNDPNGDGDFSDLICQPFKQARDATAQFLERVDFVRGDRVAFVTFDRTAFILNPYGVFIDTNGEQQRFGPMIDNGPIAEYTLNSLVGVRAEPNFYVPSTSVYDATDPAANPLTFAWSSYAAGLNERGESIPVDFGKTVYDTSDAGNPEAYIYPVYSSCPFQNAFQAPSRSMFPDGLNNATLPSATEDSRWEFPYNNSRYHDRSGGANNPYRLSDSSTQRVVDLRMSYELWASCRGTNVGAALREANNALLNPRTVRRFGTIWIIIMLGDGGAGSSDPVRRNADKLIAGNPYFRVGVAPNITYGRQGQYGAYGVCPYGTPDNPGELVRGADDPTPYTFPYCSDESPMTRRFCDFRPLLTLPRFDVRDAMQDNDYVPFVAAGDNSNSRFASFVDGTGTLVYTMKGGLPLPSNQTSSPFPGPQTLNDEEPWNRANNNLYDIDLNGLDRFGNPCNPLYDVDDYARDWADFIGLSTFFEDQNVVLPTIFTIGFGLEYPNRTLGGIPLDITDQSNTDDLCKLNPADCIGEQLLRYIADVGDNNVIDNDYYQDLYDDGVVNFLTNPIDFGPRDPCQTPFTPPGGANMYDTNGDFMLSEAEINVMYGMLRPQLSCGNYYFAPDGNELQFVFDDIASRMFTRLAR